ncbi:hypothetical protein, partial [Salmonella sp. s54395]|uniref:hypothetical protein n=1 Tax=Salmonella sp. s54395 TaxID=3159664 RepID=UPI0039806CB4
MEPLQRDSVAVYEYEWQEAVIDMQSVNSFSMMDLGPEVNSIGRDGDLSSVGSDTAPLVPYAIFSHMNNLNRELPPKTDIPKTDYSSTKSLERESAIGATASLEERRNRDSSGDAAERSETDTEHREVKVVVPTQ